MLERMLKDKQCRELSRLSGDVVMLPSLNAAKTIFIFLIVWVLSGCSGGTGEATTFDSNLGNTSGSSGSGGSGSTSLSVTTYSGPQPANQDVRDYKTFFWDEMTKDVYGCGSCHTQDGPGTRFFLRYDDINTAHSDTLPIVDLNNPGNSAIVSKVFGGHNCWVGDLSLCRDTITTFITNWANGAIPTTATQVSFVAPVDQLPSGAITFPANSSSFSNLHVLLRTHCAGCHSDEVPVQQQQTPLFAHTNIDTAYEAAKTKIDVANIENSRLVVRLRNESHNCWDVCADDADEVQAEIEALLPDTVDPVDPALVTSMALRLEADGIQASSNGRVETHVIAQYEFRLGSGTQVDDRSSITPLAPLTLLGDYEWQDNWGIKFNDGRAQASVNNSRKFYNEITSTGEFTIEAWVFPDNVTQDNTARIVSYSGGVDARNFTLGQSLYNYDVLTRSSNTDINGVPMLSTADADEDAQAALQHVVITYHPDAGRKIYVNGVDTGDTDPVSPGSFYDNWNQDFSFVLANEVSGNRSWAGTIRFVAIHKRALSEVDIQTNFDAGVGQKYYMLFRLEPLNATNGDPDGFVVFEVSQYDNYSYLFANPFYLALGETAVPRAFDLKGMRIGINGKVPSVGQAFAKLDMNINNDDSEYDPATGHPISSQGTILMLEHGSSTDQFFLSFEKLGDCGANCENVFVEATFDAPVFTGSGLEYSDIGLRNFMEIRETFAQVTGIASTNTAVRSTYDLVVQQLPSSEDILGFLSAHQMGVTQLAISYCSELIDTESARDAVGIILVKDAGGAVADDHSKSVADWNTEFIDPMLTAAHNTSLLVQPDVGPARDLIHHLLFTDADGITDITNPDASPAAVDPTPDGLARCTGGSCTGNTALAAKAACAAVLGSSAVTVQ